MPVALDTNILVTLWRGSDEAARNVRVILERVSVREALVIAPPVYAELLAAPQVDAATLAASLTQARIEINWRLDEAVWRTAALA